MHIHNDGFIQFEQIVEMNLMYTAVAQKKKKQNEIHRKTRMIRNKRIFNYPLNLCQSKPIDLS